MDKEKAIWTYHFHMIWVQICLELVQQGRRNGPSLDKWGWSQLIAEFEKKTGKQFDTKQMKNHWDMAKADWKYWNKLKCLSGLHWNEDTNTIVASDDWWTERLQKFPTDIKFRYKGLDFAKELDVIFGGTVATSVCAWSPAQANQPPTIFRVSPEDELQDDDDYIPETQPPPFVTATEDGDQDLWSQPSRRRSVQSALQLQQKKTKVSDRINNNNGHLIDSIEARNAQRSVVSSFVTVQGSSVRECILLLEKMETHVIPFGELYVWTIRKFMKDPEFREVFCTFGTDEKRAKWLEIEFDNFKMARQ